MPGNPLVERCCERGVFRNTARRAVFRNRCPGPRAHPREKERRFSCDAAARAIPPRGHLSGNAKRPEGAKLLGTRTLAAATAAKGKKVRLAGTVWGRSTADCLTGLCLVAICLAPRDGRRIGLPGCFLVPPAMQDELRRSIKVLGPNFAETPPQTDPRSPRFVGRRLRTMGTRPLRPRVFRRCWVVA